MLKRYCDLCGKNINVEKYLLMEVQSMDGRFSFKKEKIEMCDECYEKILSQSEKKIVDEENEND